MPCLLNSAACHIKLGQAAAATQGGIGGESRTRLGKALECCAEVLQAGPPAAQRAKAHFRIGQAHFALENYREVRGRHVTATLQPPRCRKTTTLQPPRSNHDCAPAV